MNSFFNKYILSSVLTGIMLTGCSHWLDVNDNPNTAEEIDAKYLFNYAVTYWSGSRCEDSYNTVGLSCQTMTDGDRYVFFAGYYEVATSAPYIWNRCYITSGNNLQLALEQLKNSPVKQPNTEAQCKIALAMQLYDATMLFGDIPFSEAWNKDIKHPKFDSQEDVLNGIVSMLDDALTLIDPEDKNCIDDHDPFYGGDMDKWKVLALSLKFRTLMVMVDADPSKAEMIGKMVEAGGMLSAADGNMEFKYSTAAGNGNPKNTLVAMLTGTENFIFFAHNRMLNPMKQYDDPRIPYYFSPLPSGEYAGLNTQDYWKDDKDVQRGSTLNNKLFKEDWPDLIYSYQEQLFFEAEVYARGLGVTRDLVKAGELYKAGVKAACDYYGVPTVATEAFFKRLPELSELTPERAIEEIHLQQWIDLMDRPLEAFVQWRRSGKSGEEVPTLTVPQLNTHPGLIRRWEYPLSEVNSNPSAPKRAPKLWEATWFDL